MVEQCHDKHISRGRIVFYIFLIIVVALLFTEHRAHVLGFLPYMFLLACPLMHLFMHHGNEGHNHSSEGQDK
jgi:hypothetical protein